jgi:hypothetical protein
MSGWLDPVRAALDGAASPVTFFVRDDDAGWSDVRLYRVLEITQYYEVPIDLATIPNAVGPLLARELRHAVGGANGLVSVHQHGFAHVNHEPTGRKKAEFGPSRSAARQRDDIAAGRRRLQDMLGFALPATFTPPWNRCTAVTAAVLVDLGFQLLSCHASTPVLAADGLEELPVHLDWTGRRGAGQGAELWGEAIAAHVVEAGGPLGLMLHHAVMTSDDWKLLSDLLALLTTHAVVHLRSMARCAHRSLSRVSR